MDLQHVNIKIFVEGDLPVEPERFINVFHQWIQEQKLPELLIDVADYGHVPGGPGILLVAHEADYSMDHTDNRWGLRYNRKARLDGTNQDRFAQSLRSAANACRLLEEHFSDQARAAGGIQSAGWRSPREVANTEQPTEQHWVGPLRFSRNEFELFINDRALAPNTPETFASCKSELETFLKKTFGHSEFKLDRHPDSRRRFGVRIKSAKPFDLSAILNDEARKT